jgi:hypothetical protein
VYIYGGVGVYAMRRTPPHVVTVADGESNKMNIFPDYPVVNCWHPSLDPLSIQIVRDRLALTTRREVASTTVMIDFSQSLGQFEE